MLANDSGPTTYLYGGVKSGYVIKNMFLASPDTVFQGGATLSWKNGVYLDLWGSTPLESNSDNHSGKEVDLTVGWKGDAGSLRMNVGIAHFNLYPVSRVNSSDIVDTFAEVSPQKTWVLGVDSTLTPFVRTEVLNSPGNNIKNALFAFAGVYSKTPLGNNWSLDQKLQIGHIPEIGKFAPGWDGYYKIGFSRTFAKHMMVGIEAQRYMAFNLDKGRTSHNIYGVTFGFPIR
jgi:hypothetical protein